MEMICKFEFKEPVKKSFIDDQIILALITAECRFGKPKVRLYSSYMSSDGNAIIDVSTEVGRHIAEVFTGFMMMELGESSFKVKRLRKK